jgi:hypothetical protein
MGQAKLRKVASMRAGALPKEAIARAVRRAVVETSRDLGAHEGLCALHAAVGQRLLRDRFKVEARIVAGDLQRQINERVVHSYAEGGRRINAAAGACHVWLVDNATKALIDFDAWEEPKRYAALGSQHGPWTAPQPEFYWKEPGEPGEGIAKVEPDPEATKHVLSRLQQGAGVLFMATALLKAFEYLDVLML